MIDVFILGSGFSRAASGAMPLLSELSNAVLGGLGEEERERVLFPQDIELSLSYLASASPWLPEPERMRNRALLLELHELIGQQIISAEESAIGVKCPAWLHDLVEHWHKTNARVLTLNYDTLVERVARLLTIPSGDQGKTRRLSCGELYPVPMAPAPLRVSGVIGSNGPSTFELFKLHGSTNWLYSGRESFFGENLYYLPVRRGWGEMFAPDRDAEAENLWYARDKRRLIAPPTVDKGSFFANETLQEIWRRAGDALSAAERVFCVGYSLPTTDLWMRFFLRSAAPQGRVKLFVVDTDAGRVGRFRELLGDLYAIDGGFAGAKAVQVMVASLCRKRSGRGKGPARARTLQPRARRFKSVPRRGRP